MLARLLMVSTLCALARGAHAQAAGADPLASLAPGARIRFTAPGIVAGQYFGVVRDRTTDRFTASGRSTIVTVPLARVTALQVSRGKSRLDGAVRGMLWAAPIGLLSGLIGRTQYGRCDGRCGAGNEFGYPDRGLGTVASSMASITVGGGIIGALVGRERWLTVLEQRNAR